jgi:hypothetical protein
MLIEERNALGSQHNIQPIRQQQQQQNLQLQQQQQHQYQQQRPGAYGAGGQQKPPPPSVRVSDCLKGSRHDMQQRPSPNLLLWY